MLAEDLIQQARHLATVDSGRPKQANLRRAISSAYYAIFHLLAAECARKIGPRSPALLGSRISRSLSHAEMKQVCKSVSSGAPSAVLRELQPAGFSYPLRNFAETFVRLQEARHAADYDGSIMFSRTTTIDLIDFAERAFQDWRTVRSHDEASVLLAALLFANRWSK